MQKETRTRFMLRNFLSLMLIFVLPCGVYAATSVSGLNKAYWELQTNYETALNSGDTAGIISSGEAIIQLFLNGGDVSVKAAEWAQNGDLELNILRGVAEEVAKTYEITGDYEGAKRSYELALPIAVAWQEINNPADTQFVKTIFENKIASYAAFSSDDTTVAVYALKNTAGATYRGAKHEPVSGVYFGEAYSTADKSIAAGKSPSASLVYVLYEHEDMASFDWIIRPLTQSRQIVQIAWNLQSEGETLAKVLNERVKIESAADYLNSLETPILLRFGAEMNVWEKKADPEVFKGAFRFVAQIMRERAPNVAMLWSPNWLGHIETTYEQFYPGDEYVDWVGVSLYSSKYFGGNKNLDDTAQAMYMTGDFANPVKQLEAIAAAYGDRKPIALSECGVENYSITNSENVSEWAKPQLRVIYEMIPVIYPQVKAIFYFNAKPNYSVASSYSIYDSPDMKALYTEVTGKEHFIPYGQKSVSVSYQKLGEALTAEASKVSLLTYAPFVKMGNLSITYRLDGNWVGAANVLPYGQTVDFSGYTDGEHTLSVLISSGDSELKTLNYKLNKNGASVTITNYTNER